MLTVMVSESLQVCKQEFKVCDLLSINKVMPKPPIRSRSGWKLSSRTTTLCRSCRVCACQWGSRPVATLKPSYKASPLQLCAFVLLVWKQHGGQKALVVCPSAPWEAVLRIQLKQLSSRWLTNWEAMPQPKGYVLDLKYIAFDLKIILSYFSPYLNAVFMWQRW